MQDQASQRARRVRLSIAGFACCEGFLLSLVSLNMFGSSSGVAPEEGVVQLALTLLVLVIGFACVVLVPARLRTTLLSPRAAVLFAVLPLAALVVAACVPQGLAAAAATALLGGLPAAQQLCAWGRRLGGNPIDQSVPVVFIASALGGALCFLAVSVPVPAVRGALFVLPLLGALLLALYERPNATTDTAPHEVKCAASDASAPAHAADEAPRAHEINARIMVGTAIYGAAAGLVEASAASEGGAGGSSESLMLLLFVVLCLAALQLFGGHPLAKLHAVLPRSVSSEQVRDGGPLDGSYRLAILLFVAGLLVAPLVERVGVTPSVVAAAGYLGVSVVLASLFLVMAHIGARDASLSFARGFSALFVGEAAGLAAGFLLAANGVPDATSLAAAAAGILVLYGFLFLFTERDLRALSVVVDEADCFDEACEEIATQAGLSKREGEVLPFVLRGRTSERIAAELFISKNTVDTHIRRIYAKCGVHNRQELIDLGEQTEAALRTQRRPGGASCKR